MTLLHVVFRNHSTLETSTFRNISVSNSICVWSTKPCLRNSIVVSGMLLGTVKLQRTSKLMQDIWRFWFQKKKNNWFLRTLNGYLIYTINWNKSSRNIFNAFSVGQWNGALSSSSHCMEIKATWVQVHPPKGSLDDEKPELCSHVHVPLCSYVRTR